MWFLPVNEMTACFIFIYFLILRTSNRSLLTPRGYAYHRLNTTDLYSRIQKQRKLLNCGDGAGRGQTLT
jgi:hypothetical protein